MLYTCTRNDAASYTARRALKEERTADGGLYVPTRLPVFSPEELDVLLNQPGADIAAQILNRFFNTRITGEDLTRVLGNRLYGLTLVGHRLLAGEFWRNNAGSFDSLCRKLTAMICAERSHCVPGMWMRIGCRIALVFAVFGELHRMDLDAQPLDVAVLTEKFEAPYALWTARNMGLNIGTILCCSNGNGFVWDLVNRGQIRLDAPLRPSFTPESDGMTPNALELYFHQVLSWNGVWFEELTHQSGPYLFSRDEHQELARGFAAAVVSEERVIRAIRNLYRSCDYILCPYSALVYAGLEDHRSRPGRSRSALMLAERNPMDCAELLQTVLGITRSELQDRVR